MPNLPYRFLFREYPAGGIRHSVAAPDLGSALPMLKKQLSASGDMDSLDALVADYESGAIRVEYDSDFSPDPDKPIPVDGKIRCPNCGHADPGTDAIGEWNCPRCTWTWDKEKPELCASNRTETRSDMKSKLTEAASASVEREITRMLVEGGMPQESYDAVDSVLPSKTRDTGQGIKRSLIQYVRSEGGVYQAVGQVVLAEKLEPGAYNIISDMTGLKFVRTGAKSDELYVFENSPMYAVLQEVDKFWSLKGNFDKLGYLHHRGVLLYGPPGTGKTSLIQQVAEQMEQRGDIVFHASNVGTLKAGLDAFRQVESARRLVVVLEDMDEYVGYQERDLLQLLDGQGSVDNCLFLGSTNYVNKFPPRLLRPGRFDKKICIGHPPMEGRLAYLQHKLKDIAEEREIQDLAKKTDGFSFGHLRELVIGRFAFGEDADSVIKRLGTVDYQELPTREPGMVEGMVRVGKETVLTEDMRRGGLSLRQIAERRRARGVRIGEEKEERFNPPDGNWAGGVGFILYPEMARDRGALEARLKELDWDWESNGCYELHVHVSPDLDVKTTVDSWRRTAHFDVDYFESPTESSAAMDAVDREIDEALALQ